MGAEEGLPFHQVVMAQQHIRGVCVPENPDEAVRWARLAAEQGFAPGQYLVGEFHRAGYGPITQNYAKAAYWYRLAAEQDVPDMEIARYKLAVMYGFGNGVPRDYVMSYAWANVAAVHHHEAIGWRDWMASLLTPEQIAEAQRLSREIWERIST